MNEDDGFGIVDAVIAMGIMFIVMGGMLQLMLASATQIQRQEFMSQETNDSESVLSILNATWGKAEYDTAIIETDHLLYLSDGTCYEFIYDAGGLGERTWTAGDTPPVDAETRMAGVESLSFTGEGTDTLSVAWKLHRAPTAPYVNAERVFVSTFDPESRPEVKDAFGNTLDPQPAPVNTCVQAFVG